MKTLDELREVALDGAHRELWTTEHIRNVAKLLNEVADEIDYANVRLDDIFGAATRGSLQ